MPNSRKAAFRLAPASLALLVLRLTLARPFFASGLTRWDGWFTLSFGTKVLFSDEYRLHVFGAEIPFPQPELVAAMASTAEIALPILLAFGILTRYAALGTSLHDGRHPARLSRRLGRTSICPGRRWRFAIIALGPGALSLDRLLGLDGFPPQRSQK